MPHWKIFIIMLPLMVNAGCSNRVYFGTSTRFALDVSTTTAGIGYKSAQFAYVPPKESGGEYSVLGRSDVDLSITDIVVNEEFATGQAAECAAAASSAVNLAFAADDRSNTKKGNLIFGSYFSVSLLDINFGSENPFAGASIGYKRESATVIPITENGQLRSVYANTKINSLANSAAETDGTRTNGIRFRQIFATGKAAVYVAKKNIASITEKKIADACTPQWQE
ncbi:hypothetical protein [Pseudomonas defluvii]|uniref:hypothetical protein n=1 Tax=Pseudomonas defluvii TaxID=1876757 RepID=UPI0039069C98